MGAHSRGRAVAAMAVGLCLAVSAGACSSRAADAAGAMPLGSSVEASAVPSTTDAAASSAAASTGEVASTEAALAPVESSAAKAAAPPELASTAPAESAWEEPTTFTSFTLLARTELELTCTELATVAAGTELEAGHAAVGRVRTAQCTGPGVRDRAVAAVFFDAPDDVPAGLTGLRERLGSSSHLVGQGQWVLMITKAKDPDGVLLARVERATGAEDLGS